MIARDLRILAMWCAIWALIVIGLSTSIIASFESLRPEIVIETCSLLAALLLVVAERLAGRYALRRASLNSVVEELKANAIDLFTGVWTMDGAALRRELSMTHSGLRFYYPHLSTAAVSAAVLGPAFDVRRDPELVEKLREWRAAAEGCNARLAMAQLLLFFLPATEDGMRERLKLHASIAAVPAVQTRDALQRVCNFLRLSSGGRIPDEAMMGLNEIASLVADSDVVEYSTGELTKLAHQAS